MLFLLTWESTITWVLKSSLRAAYGCPTFFVHGCQLKDLCHTCESRYPAFSAVIPWLDHGILYHRLRTEIQLQVSEDDNNKVKTGPRGQTTG